MDKNEIISSIQNWQAIRKDSAELLRYLGQGNSFLFIKKEYTETSDYWHAYPGIYKEKLILVLLPSAYDNAAHSDAIAKNAEICNLFTEPLETAEIASGTALKRIDTWAKDYSTWVPLKAATPNSIFSAFAIPYHDFKASQGEVHFALQADAGQPMNYNADMIVSCREEVIIYEDFATPVPPYGSNITKTSFYLLSL